MSRTFLFIPGLQAAIQGLLKVRSVGGRIDPSGWKTCSSLQITRQGRRPGRSRAQGQSQDQADSHTGRIYRRHSRSSRINGQSSSRRYSTMQDANSSDDTRLYTYREVPFAQESDIRTYVHPFLPSWACATTGKPTCVAGSCAD